MSRWKDGFKAGRNTAVPAVNVANLANVGQEQAPPPHVGNFDNVDIWHGTPAGAGADPWADVPPNDPRYTAEWRRWHNLLVLHYRELGHDDAEAGQLAHGRAVCLWHEHYGSRTPAGTCAGCGESMSGQPFGLPDGTAVHNDPDFTCLAAYGVRWRGAAADALAALGVPIDGDPPATDAPTGFEIPY